MIAVPIILLGIFNLFDQIQKHQNVIQKSYLTITFIVFGIMIFILKRKVIFSMIFLFIAIFTILDPSNISDYSASIFFIYAFHLIKNKWYGIALSAATMISIAYRATNDTLTIYQSFGMLIGFTVVYLIYYFIIYRQIKPTSIKIDDLSETESKILSGLASGQSQKTTIGNMGLTKSQGYDSIKKIKEKLNSESMDEIMFNLGRNKYSKTRKEK